MKDIPMFTTENGIASLILQEIPYTGRGYIRIRSSQNSEALVKDCISFLRMVGAEEIYAAGEGLGDYPLHARVVCMSCMKERIPDADACLFPVTEQTLEQWRQIYNRSMAQVPNAAWMSEQQAKQMLAAGDGYFIHKNGELLGIGKASGGKVEAVAAVVQGCGETVMQALCSVLCEEVVTLEVAAQNQRAMHLYQRMGFMQTAEVSRWYRVL